MNIRIQSDKLVSYLAMGWRVSDMQFNCEECWLVMEGSLRSRILMDLGLTEDDIKGKKTITGTRITCRMLCCWYGIQRYGLTYAYIGDLFDRADRTAAHAHKRVNQLITVGGINLPDEVKKIAT